MGAALDPNSDSEEDDEDRDEPRKCSFKLDDWLQFKLDPEVGGVLLMHGFIVNQYVLCIIFPEVWFQYESVCFIIFLEVWFHYKSVCFMPLQYFDLLSMYLIM